MSDTPSEERPPWQPIAGLGESNTLVPVTPGISRGTYSRDSNPPPRRVDPSPRQRYRTPQSHYPRAACFSGDPGYFCHDPTDIFAPGEAYRKQKLQQPDHLESRNVLSATFTLPQAIQYIDGGEWKISQDTYHCSAHLDSLAQLSSSVYTCHHTVIAWTGEIAISSANEEPPQASIPMPTTATQCKQPRHDDEAAAKEVFVSKESQARLEEMLYSDSRVRTLPVWLADDRDITDAGIRLKQQSRWRRYAEHDLCALFHYKQHPPTDGRKADDRWDDYRRVNEAYADRISKAYKPGDIVVVHDHYLMLLPELLRQRHPDMNIIFYLESPFPTSELVRCLHRRRDILNGVLGADLICFQAFHYAQHFANSCARILGSSASRDWVGTTRGRVYMSVSPLGINIAKITWLAFADSVDKKYEELRKLFKGTKVIIGCDPMDRLGGVHKKLEAFRCFLERYPTWQGKVVLLQVTGPSTLEDDDGESIAYARKVNELVNSINQDYGSLDYAPVQLHAQKLSQDEYFALLRIGDVAVNTCVREGMSTTSLEYVACQRDNHAPLIISEFSGTASSLKEAIQINPWDIGQVAAQINNALVMMPAMRSKMHEALYNRVKDGQVERSVDGMLRRGDEVFGARERMKKQMQIHNQMQKQRQKQKEGKQKQVAGSSSSVAGL